MSNKEIISIRAYGFVDALQQLQPYLKDNYKIDFESNEGYPQSFGVNFTYTVIEVSEEKPSEPVEITEKVPEEETKTVKVRGRTKQEKSAEDQ